MEYKVVYMDLPTTINGFARRKDGFYTIVLNSRSSAAQQKECFEHELKHIANDDFESLKPADLIEWDRHKKGV